MDTPADISDGAITETPSPSPGALDLMTIPLVGSRVGFGVDMFSEVCIVVVVVAAFCLKDVALISNGIDVRARVVIDFVACTIVGVPPGITVDFVATALISVTLCIVVDMFAGTDDAGMRPPTMITLAFMSPLTLSKDSSRFDSEALRCWTAIVRECQCRALQA